MELKGACGRTFARLVVSAIFLPLMLSACRGDGSPSSRQATAGTSSSSTRVSISGAPGNTVAVGQRYTFLPATTNPERSTLGYSIRNLPKWAQFDTTTGRLSGTPGAEHIGKYSDIVISASDGRGSVALPAFAIQVVAANASTGSGAATLSWLPPTQNTDGSPLSNLAGYEIQYGRNSASLDQTIRLSNASLSIYVVDNLAAGTWYFAIVAISSGGATSEPSAVVSKTIS
jgi:putative Ig domain-containing protein